MAISYPSGLPLARVDSYSSDVATGVSAVTFERGNNRQRRGSRREKHVFGLSFTLTTAQLWVWQSWANRYGYQWHLMPLVSPYSVMLAGMSVVDHTIRYTSNISWESVSNGVVRAYVSAEMDVSTLPSGTIEPSGNWYVGGTPAAPATNRIIAGTPAAPATDVIIAGTPRVPAA